MINKDKILGDLSSDPKAAELLGNKNQLKKILASDEAKKLMEMLNSDGGIKLRMAAEAASAGDGEKARQILEPILQRKDAQELLGEIGRKAEGHE